VSAPDAALLDRLDRVAAIDGESLPRDPPRPVGHEERDRLGDVVGAAEAAKGERAASRVQHALCVRAGLRERMPHAVLDEPTCDAIGPHTEPALFGSDAAYERGDGRLGCRGQQVLLGVPLDGRRSDGEQRASCRPQRRQRCVEEGVTGHGVVEQLRTEPGWGQVRHVVHRERRPGRVDGTGEAEPELFDCAGYLFLHTQVDPQSTKGVPGRPQLGAQRLSRRGVGEVGRGHTPAVAGQCPAHRGTNSPRTAPDEDPPLPHTLDTTAWNGVSKVQEDRQRELLQRFFDMRENRRVPLAESVYRMPSDRYVDSAEAAAEQQCLFRERPLFIGLTGDVPHPGDYLTLEVAGLPVVLVRGEDGLPRALVNACRHRGAPVFEGRGNVGRRAVTCPFHGWVYDLRGCLLGQPQSDGGFAGCDRSTLSLPELVTTERHGMIFVAPLVRAAHPMGEPDPLGTAAEDLAAFELAGYRHIESRTRTISANWKLVMDSFLESYHIRSLHAASIGPYYFSAPSIFEDLGDVGLLIGVRSTAASQSEVPVAERRLLPHATVQYVLPPCGLLVHQLDHVETWTVLPGLTPDRCIATTSVHVPPQADDADVARARRNLLRLLAVTDAEDFDQATRIQRALAGGALPELLFGRNEPALVHFHRVLDRALAR
jgi:phenylpropionate dioxygenase-like ring-hydroxylating dioxygenase large terminal subunit